MRQKRTRGYNLRDAALEDTALLLLYPQHRPKIWRGQWLTDGGISIKKLLKQTSLGVWQMNAGEQISITSISYILSKLLKLLEAETSCSSVLVIKEGARRKQESVDGSASF